MNAIVNINHYKYTLRGVCVENCTLVSSRNNYLHLTVVVISYSHHNFKRVQLFCYCTNVLLCLLLYYFVFLFFKYNFKHYILTYGAEDESAIIDKKKSLLLLTHEVYISQLLTNDKFTFYRSMFLFYQLRFTK